MMDEDEQESLLTKQLDNSIHLILKKESSVFIAEKNRDYFSKIANFVFILAFFTFVINFMQLFGYRLGDFGVVGGEIYSSNPHQTVISFNNIIFRSNFDSGNLLKVQQSSAFHFKIWFGDDTRIISDINHTLVKRRSGSNSGFFEIKRLHQPVMIDFRIENLKLSKELLRHRVPFYYRHKAMGRWRQIKRVSRAYKQRYKRTASIQFRFKYNPIYDKEIQFSLFPTWTYKDDLRFYREFEKSIPKGYTFYYEKLADTKFQRSLNICWLSNVKEEQVKTQITLNSSQATLNKTLDNVSSSQSLPLNLKELYTLKNIYQNSNNKKYIIMMARSYGFDTTSSYFLKDVLELLVNSKQKGFPQILDRYIFVLIPMLNPDGVYQGYSKVDGDFNVQGDVIMKSSPEISREIFAVKEFVFKLIDTKMVHSVFHFSSEPGRTELGFQLPVQTEKNSHFIHHYPSKLSLGKSSLIKKHSDILSPFSVSEQTPYLLDLKLPSVLDNLASLLVSIIQ